MNTVKLHPDLREFVALLNAGNVDYLIVGARALAFYGTPRMTGDLDFFVSTTPQNVERLLHVLHEFGFGGVDISAEDFTTAEFMLQLGHAPNRIDILTSLTGLSFEEAWRDKQHGELEGIPVHYLSREHFIVNKRAIGRPKDIADIEAISNTM